MSRTASLLVAPTVAAFRRTERGGRDGQRADRARRACFGRAAASGTARGGDDALLFRSEFQGYRGTNRREYKYRVGAYALCAYQPATDDQRKKYGFMLIPHNISMGRAFS